VHRDTLIVHAGYRKRSEPGVLLAGPQFSSTYTSPGDPTQHAHAYGRFHNPTWTAWEDALGILEGGEAVAFASGMAAVAAVFGVTLRRGDCVVLPADGYYAIRRVASTWLESLGVEVRLVPTKGGVQPAVLEGATLLWLETPANPLLDVCDIAGWTAAANARRITVAVDNTTATPYLQQPLAHGAAIVMASDTKALTGHSDLLLGHVATRESPIAEALRAWRTDHGAIPGPMEVWLAHRSLPTLPVRINRQCATAERLAAVLASRSDVAAVYYPGLRDHSGHEVAKRQMHAFGTVVSFDLGTRARAETFLDALTIVRQATSFGGVHSMAERRARWRGETTSEGLIRFSVGCEAADDILNDVEDGLRAAAPQT
jgi:cystathionine gamma-lyase